MVKLQNLSGAILDVADFSVEYLKSKGWTEPKSTAKPAPKKRAPRKKAADNGNG